MKLKGFYAMENHSRNEDKDENPLRGFAEKAHGILKQLPVIGEWVEKKPKVAVLRLSGIIADTVARRGGISHAKYSKLIDKAFKTGNLQAVALVINCPGGAPAQSALIAGHILRLSQEKNVPVLAFVEDVAASGGYWLACAADEIYVQQSSIVGSIGVISTGFGLDTLIEKYGIERRVYTAGKDKSFLDPFQPEKATDIQRLRQIQADIHSGFKDWVRERRGKLLKAKENELFEGAFWTGETAVELGIADDIGEVHAIIRQKYGEDIKFRDLQPDKKFLPPLLGAKHAALSTPDILTNALFAAEDRAAWQRFGL
jgi:signal peptide peptidase SppA